MNSEEIRRVLGVLNLTQTELAAKVEVSMWAVSKWLADKAHPRKITQRKIRDLVAQHRGGSEE